MGFFAFSKLFGVSSLVTLILLCTAHLVNGIGANWGTQSTHNLPPDIVVTMLKDNGFQKVKLFDADYDTLKALGKSGIEVMVGIPNDMLTTLGSLKAAEKWVSKNVTVHISDNNINISTEQNGRSQEFHYGDSEKYKNVVLENESTTLIIFEPLSPLN